MGLEKMLERTLDWQSFFRKMGKKDVQITIEFPFSRSTQTFEASLKKAAQTRVFFTTEKKRYPEDKPEIIVSYSAIKGFLYLPSDKQVTIYTAEISGHRPDSPEPYK